MNSQVLYSEDFDDPALDQKGVIGGGTPVEDMTGVTTFTIDYSAASLTATTDFFKVDGGEMVAQDVDGEVVWLSSVVDISAEASVNFSIDIIENGDHETSDYVDVEYLVNGTPTLITNWMSFGSASHTFVGDLPDDTDWVSSTVTQTGITGSTLQLRVTLNNGAGTENLIIDNVLVTGAAAVADLIISEIHYNPNDANGFADTDYEFVEIYNNEGSAVDLENYVLNGLGFTFGAGASIAAGEYIIVAVNDATYTGNGYQVFDATGALANGGETIELVDDNGVTVDEVTYDESTPWPEAGNGEGPSIELTALASDNSVGANWHSYNCQASPSTPNGTPGAANSTPGNGCTDPSALNYDFCASTDDASCTYPASDVIITEIHYNPCGSQGPDADYEFLEIHNMGVAAVDITGWEVANGINFTFPATTTILPGEYIIVADNAATYSGNGYQVFEWGTGQALTNSGELVSLENDAGITVDEFTYDDGAPWPTTPDADCSSLELIDPSLDSSLPSSWQGSFVFGGTPGAGNSSAKECADCGEVGTQTDLYLSDDFETLGISQWTATADWDTTSTLALSGSFSLAHEGTTAGSSSISTPLECLQIDAACTTWSFEIQTYDWTPSAENDFKAFLAADQSDFSATDLNAVAVRINGSDEIEFVSIENGVTSVLLNTGLVWSNFMSLGFEIIYAESDVWYFKMDVDGSIDNPFIFGTDITYTPAFDLLHFGFEFDHGLDAAGLLVIDNVEIKQCGLPETYYSVASGNVSDAIWNTDTNALIGEDVEFTKFKTMNIRNAAAVVVDNNLQLNTLEVEDTNGAGTLSFSSSEQVQIHNNLSVLGGTLTPGSSSFLFKGTAAQLINAASATLNDVELRNSNGLSLLNNLSLNGQLTLTEGTFATGANTLTLNSSAAGTASIGEIQTDADFSGTVEMQRFIPTGVSNWVNISAPVTAQTIASWDDDIITTGFTGSQWPLYPFNNIQSYDETIVGGLNDGWNETTDITNALSENRGYMAYMLGTTQLLDLTGSIQKGSVQVNLNYSPGGGVANDGWELCSNIYPCDIHFDQLYALSNNISDTYYVYDAETGNYATYTVGLGGTAGEIISSSQSFWVQTTGSGAYIQFEESIKSTSSTAFERYESAEPFVVLELEGIGKVHESVVTFNDQYTANFDAGKDAIKLGSMDEFSPEISTMSADGQQLSVNRMAWNNGIIEVPIHLHLDSISDYTLRLKEVEHLPSNACLALVDLQSGESWPIVASEEIEFVIDEHKNDVLFALQIITAASVDVENASCQNQSNGAVLVTNELNEGDFVLFDLNFNQLAEATVTAGETHAFNNLPQGDYYVQAVNSVLPCNEQGFWTYVDAETLDGASVTTLIDNCNETGTGNITINHSNAFTYQLSLNNEVIETGEGNEFEIVDLNSELTYELELSDECGTTTQTIVLTDPMGVTGEIQGDFNLQIQDNNLASTYQANTINANSFEWLVDGETVGNGESIELEFNAPGDYLLTLDISGINCSNSISEWIHVDQAINVNESLENLYQLLVSDGSLLVNGEFNQTGVSVFNNKGQLVYNQLHSGEQITLSTSQFSAGIYYIKIGEFKASFFVGHTK